MLTKLKERVMEPEKPIPIRILLRVLLIQAALLFFVLIVLMVWPERARALGTFVLMSLGIAGGLWLNIREAGLEQSSATDHERTN